MANNKISIKELRKICQRRGTFEWETQTYWGRLNRIFSVYLTRVFISLPFSPNQITALNTLVFIAGVSLYIFHIYWLNILGLLLIIFSGLLDAVDGELARYRKIKKGLGSYVEPVSHDIQYSFTFLPIAWGIYAVSGSGLILLLAAIATIGKLIRRLLDLRYRFLQWQFQKEKQNEKEKRAPFSYNIYHKIYRNLFTPCGFIPPLLLTTIFDKLHWFVIFYGIGLPAVYLISFTQKSRRIRKFSSSNSPRAIVFDLDGTLVDTMIGYANIAAKLISECYNLDYKTAKEAYIKTSGIPFFQQLEELFPKDSRNKETAQHFEKRKLTISREKRMSEDTKKTLEELSSLGFNLVVSSNNFQDNVDKFVKRERINFDLVLGYKEGFGKGEPHFNYIKRRLGVKPKEIIFVADSLKDAQRANLANIPFIAKLGTFNQKEFHKHFPNLPAIEKFSEIYKFL